MYPNVLNEISKNNWAMQLNSFNGILKGVSSSLEHIDYELFHRLDEEVKATTLSFLGTPVSNTSYSRRKGNIGSLLIDGPIIPRGSAFSDVSGLTSISSLMNEFQALEADADIEKILLVIDSPGGSVTGLSDFVQVLNESQKPIEAINLGLMASAAYWIGSAADKIYSADTGLIGSIGTILSMPDPDDRSTVIVSTQSPRKNMDITTKEGKADAQRIVDDLAAIFITSVASNRGVSEKTVLSKYGKGAVFVAKDALGRGLIDGIISLKDYMSGSQNIVLDSGDNAVGSSEARSEIPRNVSNTEERKMENLAQVIAEYPGIAAEVEKLKAEAFANGQQVQIALAEKVAPTIKSDVYKAPVKLLCCDVLTGKEEYSALKGALTVLDTQAEESSIQAATEDTNDVGETKSASNVDAVSEEVDFEASVKEQRLQLI